MDTLIGYKRRQENHRQPSYPQRSLPLVGCRSKAKCIAREVFWNARNFNCAQPPLLATKVITILASRSHAFTRGEKAWTTAYTRVVQLCTKSCNPIRLQIGETSRTRTFLRLRFASRLYTCIYIVHVYTCRSTLYMHGTPGETGPR